MRDRGGRRADDFVVARALAEEYFDRFEPPSPDEGPLTVLR